MIGVRELQIPTSITLEYKYWITKHAQLGPAI
jgi:hypothetical protein